MRALRLALVTSIAGCITIPGPAGDDAPPDAGELTCRHTLGELQPSPAFDPRATADDLLVVDLDRDGLDDVVALLRTGVVAVARANADGGFDEPVELALERIELYTLTAVDLDGDLDVDVVAGGSDLVVLRNDAGALTEQTRHETTCVVGALASGQFDDDVGPDVVAACPASGDVLLLRHDLGAVGSLAAPVAVASFPGLTGVAAGDIVGDARDDLVVFGDGLELLRGIGAGSFATTHLADGAAPAAAIGDVDADGRDDLVAWTGDGLAWLRGASTVGTLAPVTADVDSPRWLELARVDDVPGDDLVLVEGDDAAGSRWRTLVVTGLPGDVALEVLPVLAMAGRCRAGHLDVDDAVDVACVVHYGQAIVPVLHRGAVPAVTRPLRGTALIAQLDADPPLEIVTTDPVEVLEPAGDRFVVEASTPDGYIDGDPVAAADWTGDGRPDLLVRRYSPNDALVVWPATGIGTFGAPVDLTPSWIQPAVGDLDGDGRPDVAGWRLPDGGDPVLHVAFGGPGATIAQTITHPGLRSLAVADIVPGDSPELIVASSGELQVVSAADRTLTVRGRIGTEHYPLQVVAGDLDGDGDLDLATTEHASGDDDLTYVRTYVRDDDGRFLGRSSHPLRGWVDALALADVDGDGRIDVAAGTLALLRGQGDGSVAAPVTFARPGLLHGAVRAPAGAADQLVFQAWSFTESSLEMLAPGCR